MSKCRACKHLDLSKRTASGFCLCTNTNRRRHTRYGIYKNTYGHLRQPSANACKTGFEPRRRKESEADG